MAATTKTITIQPATTLQHTTPYLTQQHITQLTTLLSTANLTFVTLVQHFVLYCLNTTNPLHTVFVSCLYLASVYCYHNTPYIPVSKSITVQQRIATLYILLNYNNILQYILQTLVDKLNTNTSKSQNTQQQVTQILHNNSNIQTVQWLQHPFITVLLAQYTYIQSNKNTADRNSTQYVLNLLYTYMILQQTINCNTIIQQYKPTSTPPTDHRFTKLQEQLNMLINKYNNIQHTQQCNTTATRQSDVNTTESQNQILPSIKTNGHITPITVTETTPLHDDWSKTTNTAGNTIPQSWEEHTSEHNADNGKSDELSESKSESSDDKHITELNELLEKAYKTTLVSADKNKLIELYKQYTTDIPKHVNFTTNNLAALIDKNPVVASELLIHIHNTDIELFELYLTQLITIDVSLHSMEVVNRLTGTLTLSSDFLRQYINTCLLTCTRMTDKYLQTRLVRLVCVFISSLLRNNIVDSNVLGSGLLIELQSFALDYAKVKEATALYKLIKTIE